MELLLKNSNLVMVDSSKIVKADVLIRDGKVSQISESITSDVETIDCSGKWIIPGLIDMHVHIKESFAPLFTASGVTTVRNTSGSIYELEGMMKACPQAKTPRIITSDRLIDGPPGLWGPTSPYSVNIDHVELAEQEVDRQVELGANLIKVYGLLDGPIMEAVCQRAKKHNLQVSADLVSSSKVDAIEAARLGVKWLEHASGILQVVHPNWSMKADESVWASIDWKSFDEDRMKEVCQTLIDKEVGLCPTLALYDQGYLDDLPWKPTNHVMTKLEENKGLLNQWSYIQQSGHMKNKIGIQRHFIKSLIKIYHDMGGLLVCGTDSPAGVNVYPGMALHRELELFVESGMTTFEALKAATMTAADAINREDLGRIEVGAYADLVVLHTNPISSIENTKDIALIIKGGRAYSQSEILEAVPTEEEHQILLEQLIKRFEDEGFSLDMFQ